MQVPDEEEDFDIFARRRNGIKDRGSSVDMGSGKCRRSLSRCYVADDFASKEPIYSRPIREHLSSSGTDGSDDEDGHRRKRKRNTSHHASRNRAEGRIEEESESDASNGDRRLNDRYEVDVLWAIPVFIEPMFLLLGRLQLQRETDSPRNPSPVQGLSL